MKEYFEDYIDKLRSMILKLCENYIVFDGTGSDLYCCDEEKTASDIQEAEELVKQDYYLL